MTTTQLAEKYKIDEHTIKALLRYKDSRIETGSFLRCVLENDLFGAVQRADRENQIQISGIVRYIWNEFPVGIYGNSERVINHLNRK